jgi:hypothetical protein
MAVLLCVGAAAARGDDRDSDHDGLPDFQETHKYFTNPDSADSDGDGVPDGDWHERREFTYSIRSVVKVMRPCDPSVVNDDYQDARVLSETDAYVELEVVNYPFNTNAAAIKGSREWRTALSGVEAFLKPGVTTNWDDALRRDLVRELQADGIDLRDMTDRQVVERVADWLLARGKYRYMFGTYFVHFPKGKAEIFPGLEPAFRREQGNTDLPFDEHLQHEVFGKGMFENRCYGTCTSAAIYLTTALRAAGIPTRMILAIPPADGSDPRQVRMIEEHISHHQVRRTLLRGLPSSGFASHTMNEVYVGGRWRRLNYRTLGQNSYGAEAMGMLTHVLTFHDLSEAGLTKTWGWRYGRGERDDTFQGSNPYRLVEISDRFGIHSQLKNTPVDEPTVATISKAYWFLSDQRPASIPADSVKPQGDGHLLVHVDVAFDDLKDLYPKLDKDFVLTAEGQPAVRARAERGYWNQECYLHIPKDQFAAMVPGVAYDLAPAKTDGPHRWRVEGKVTIVKPK